MQLLRHHRRRGSYPGRSWSRRRARARPRPGPTGGLPATEPRPRPPRRRSARPAASAAPPRPPGRTGEPARSPWSAGSPRLRPRRCRSGRFRRRRSPPGPGWRRPGTTASAVAMNVLAGRMHSSPGPTPSARSAISMASVPLPTPTQCRVPMNAAYSVSNAATCGPSMKAVRASTCCPAVRHLLGDGGVLRGQVNQRYRAARVPRCPDHRTRASASEMMVFLPSPAHLR